MMSPGLPDELDALHHAMVELDELLFTQLVYIDLHGMPDSLPGAAGSMAHHGVLENWPDINRAAQRCCSARIPGESRPFASCLGIGPREHSSGGKRQLGRISKQGDVYLRMLLTHGARSLLNSARRARRKGQSLDRLRQWAIELSDRVGSNKATVALANKLARRLWAAEHHGTRFDPEHVSVRPTAG